MKKQGILVVEDDLAIQEILALFLEMEGYQTYRAANGSEALALLEDIERPFVILLDLMMPIMNGWQFMEVIRKDDRFAAIPIIVVSAVVDEKIKALGATHFIRKPVDLEILLSTIKQF